MSEDTIQNLMDSYPKAALELMKIFQGDKLPSSSLTEDVVEKRELTKTNKKEDSDPTKLDLINKAADKFEVAQAWPGDAPLAYSNILERFVDVGHNSILLEIYQEWGKYFTMPNMKEVIERIRIRATEPSIKLPLALRFYVPINNRHIAYMDLGRSMCVELKPNKFEVIKHPKTFVFADVGNNILPAPDPEGTVEDILKLLQPPLDDEQAALVLGWMINVFNVQGPRAILYLYGEYGAGKSWLGKKILHVLDPRGDLTTVDRAPPKDLDSLGAHLKNLGIFLLSNLTQIKPWLAAGLDQVISGVEQAERTKYTNFEISVAEGKRNVLITAIKNLITKGDLRDRTIYIKVKKQVYRDNIETDTDNYITNQAKALGGLCNIVCSILANYGKLEDEWRSGDRMDSLRYWCECGAEKAGWTKGYFATIYDKTRSRRSRGITELDPFTESIIQFMYDRHNEKGEWEGRYIDLLSNMPKEIMEYSGQKTRAEFERCLTDIEDRGIEVNLMDGRDHGGSARLRLSYTEEVYKEILVIKKAERDKILNGECPPTYPHETIPLPNARSGGLDSR